MKRALIFGATTLLAAGTAFAQDATPLPTTDPNAGTTPAVTATTGGDIAWPVAINDRPLVLSKDKLEVHGGIPIVTVSETDPTTNMSSSQTTESLLVGATYGAADKVEVGADYAARLHPDASGKGYLDFHGAYAAMKSGKLELAVAAGLQVLFIDGVSVSGNPPMVTQTTNTDLALQIGAWLRYQVAPKVSIFTGNPNLPNGMPGILSFVFPPVGYQLSIGLNNGGPLNPITLQLPVGAGFQATPNVYAFAATDLASINISNSSNAFIFSDFIPLGVGAFYSMPKVDVGVTLYDNLKNAGDFYALQFLLRYYVK